MKSANMGHSVTRFPSHVTGFITEQNEADAADCKL